MKSPFARRAAAVLTTLATACGGPVIDGGPGARADAPLSSDGPHCPGPRPPEGEACPPARACH